MNRKHLPGGNGLTSLPLGFDYRLGNVETWAPRRIAIAGVRFQTGGATSVAGGDDAAKAAADKAATDQAAADEKAAANKIAAEADKGKTPEQLAAAKKVADDEKAAAELAAKNGTGKAGDKPKAPDKYELTVPDDAKEFLGKEDLADLETVARENDWTQEEAQAFLDGQLGRAQKRLDDQRLKWENDTKADPDYGGDKLAETTQFARKAVAALRPEGHPRREAFLRFLNRGGAGNHIEVVSFLSDLGKLMGEDSSHLGTADAGKGEKKADKAVLFPSSEPKP